MAEGFDTHCHLDLRAFDPDRDAVWSRAQAAGVTRALVPAVRPADWDRTARVHLPDARWIALGIHPLALPDLPAPERSRGLETLAARLRATPGVVALGECGLDGRHPLAPQVAVFRAQLEIAAALDLPLVVHAFGCHPVVLEVLGTQRLPSRPGVIHSFSGSAELARAYLARGFHLSFAGAITRPRARRPLEALRATPRSRLLFETDAPDQRPSGITRDDPRTEPCDLGVVIARAAEVLGVPPAALTAQATANARDLFGV